MYDEISNVLLSIYVRTEKLKPEDDFASIHLVRPVYCHLIMHALLLDN